MRIQAAAWTGTSLITLYCHVFLYLIYLSAAGSYMHAYVSLYLYLQDGGESFSIFCNPSDVESSGKNRRVVVLILDVNYHLSRVS